MRYIPATAEEVAEMLAAIGLERIDDLFSVIPESLLFEGPLDLPDALCEWELTRHMSELAERNEAHRYDAFLGGGAYAHFGSAVVDALISRSEFATAYTPYQPEVSQGTLQALFEFQGYVCELLGMEVSNASVYDAASALAEAALMAERIQRKKSPKRVVLSQTVNPQYRAVVKAYLQSTDIEVLEAPFGPRGETDWAAMAKIARDAATAVLVQSPNYFGVIEDLRNARAIADDSRALLVVANSEPVALGILAPPGTFGADIAVAEGQSLGIPLSFGGPYVGLFATLQRHVRAMPGRLAGATVDANGDQGFVLTLSTREQHIRRDRATSNICTNQGLCALAATIHLSLVGKLGLQRLARLNLSKSSYLARAIGASSDFEIRFEGYTFNEFVVRANSVPVGRLLERLEAHRILGGIPLGPAYPELEDCFLVTVTETTSRAAMDRLVSLLDKEGRK